MLALALQWVWYKPADAFEAIHCDVLKSVGWLLCPVLRLFIHFKSYDVPFGFSLPYILVQS